jgi:rRNA processing protein Krr1/Pno1
MELIKWSKEQLKYVIDTENKRLRELDAQLTQISIDKQNRAKQVLAKSFRLK